jgi:hypothetical protein
VTISPQNLTIDKKNETNNAVGAGLKIGVLALQGAL